MNIDKDLLYSEYINGNFGAFFKTAKEITEFIIARKYCSIAADPDEEADVVQDCLVSLWDKVIQNKIDVEKNDNLMAFVWKNSTYKILDYLKKKNRRESIIYFLSYEEELTESYHNKKFGDSDEDYS